jgi:uncharacterized protein YlxW (UPF0749 family)
MSRQPPGLVARIRQMRRAAAAASGPVQPSPSRKPSEPVLDQVADLQARLTHLEQLVQGLQDSVHRASERQDRRMAEIERQVEPTALAAALSRDARERGL